MESEKRQSGARLSNLRSRINVRTVILGFVGIVVVMFLFLAGSVLSLRWINPPVTAFTLQEDWREHDGDRYSLREWWAPYDELPHHTKWAVIASEDQQFYDHWGFDIASIRQVLEERGENEQMRGASTISQQVAKNLYLWPGVSYVRKMIEAGITVLIELFWPKERIVEVYLNIAEFGPGIYGIGKASDAFFGISASRLEPDMSARLAAVLPSPGIMRVEPPSPYAYERSRWILRQMTHLTGTAYYTPAPDDPDPDDDAPWMMDFDVELELDLDLDEYSMFDGLDTMRDSDAGDDPADASYDTDLLFDLDLELPSSGRMPGTSLPGDEPGTAHPDETDPATMTVDPDSIFDFDLELDTSGLPDDLDTLLEN